MAKIKQQTPRFQLLLQGIINPQGPCRVLGVKTSNPQPILVEGRSKQIGVWAVEVQHHRILVHMQIWQKWPSDQTDAFVGLQNLQQLAAQIATIVLQAQALYSNIRLSLTAYTITWLEDKSTLHPMWFSPSLPTYPGEDAISNEVFIKAAEVIAWPSISDKYLQQALRDYDIALDYDDENTLLFLWRAVEAILYAHNPPNSIDDKVCYSPGVDNLKLHIEDSDDKKTKEKWTREIGKLAHRFARHGTEQVGKVTAQQIAIARNRVSEMIVRHAQYAQGQREFDNLAKDALTDWITEEDLPRRKC